MYYVKLTFHKLSVIFPLRKNKVAQHEKKIDFKSAQVNFGQPLGLEPA